MSWDHVPPKGGIELTPVRMQSILDLMTGDTERPKQLISQNGMKFRTICRSCNSLLGTKYDPTLNEFAISVGHYLNTALELPDQVSHLVKPQRLMKAILGHLLAAKVEIENTTFDQEARKYVLDESAHLPSDINIFYWPYPYECSVTIRDFGMFTPRGTFNKPAIFQTMKYFPIAYLCSDVKEYAGLACLSWYREMGLDDEIEIPINLKQTFDQHWPEAAEGNNIFFGGASATGSVRATPKS